MRESVIDSIILYITFKHKTGGVGVGKGKMAEVMEDYKLMNKNYYRKLSNNEFRKIK